MLHSPRTVDDIQLLLLLLLMLVQWNIVEKKEQTIFIDTTLRLLVYSCANINLRTVSFLFIFTILFFHFTVENEKSLLFLYIVNTEKCEWWRVNAIPFSPSNHNKFPRQFDLADRLSHYVQSQNAKINKFTTTYICIHHAIATMQTNTIYSYK